MNSKILKTRSFVDGPLDSIIAAMKTFCVTKIGPRRLVSDTEKT